MQFSVGTMPHADVMRSIELFGTEVAPAVRSALAPVSELSTKPPGERIPAYGRRPRAADRARTRAARPAVPAARGSSFRSSSSASTAGLAYVSGHGPFDGDRLLITGSVGGEVSVEQADEAARSTALSMLASLEQELGDLDRVTSWIKILGFVKCAEGFNVTPAAINGFSDLIL